MFLHFLVCKMTIFSYWPVKSFIKGVYNFKAQTSVLYVRHR